jgi:hypothetical protein
MKLKLVRKIFTNKSTIGSLYINDEYFCDILEDKDRGLLQSMLPSAIAKLKVFGETAIPYGTYEVVITFSDRFKQRMPLLVNVNGYTGVRIHKGNKVEDTHGCLLTGTRSSTTPDVLAGGSSTIAYDKLFKVLDKELKVGKVFIEITK